MVEKEKDQKQYAIDIVSATMERTNRRLFILCILLAVLLFGCVGYIIWEKEVYDVTVTETYTSESDDGGVAIVNRDGEVNYGESDLHKNEETDSQDGW